MNRSNFNSHMFFKIDALGPATLLKRNSNTAFCTLKYIINAAKNTPTLCTKSPSTWMNAARTFKSFRIFDLDFTRLSYSTFECEWEWELLSSLPPGGLFPEPWEWPWPPPNPWECPCPDPWSAIPSLEIKNNNFAEICYSSSKDWYYTNLVSPFLAFHGFLVSS